MTEKMKNNKKAVLRRKVLNALEPETKKTVKKSVLKKEKAKEDGRVKVSDDVYYQICDDIADGMSLRKACTENKVSRISFFARIRKDDDLHNHYVRAREYAGDACLDKIDEVEELLKAGEIDSSSANVLIQTEKWKAGKYYPKMYGDTTRTQIVDENGAAINPFETFYKAVCEKKDYTR